ncbi:MAG TPA: HAMP domain-containing sensor histidine kinase [Thermoleophilaceae bacterium]|jgi:two-component system sensor histidine kinase MprB|nr:HAMP domain-containing sensor histidine kinase [Thermoleophilaceae bacterium]
MSLRGRLTVMAAAIVGAILTLGAVVCFVAMRTELRSQVDDTLREQAQLIRARTSGPQGARARLPRRLPAPPRARGGAAPFMQTLNASGAIVRASGEVHVPVTAADRAVARGSRQQLLDDRNASGVHLRVLTIHLKGAGAVQLGRSLDSTDQALAHLRTLLIALVLGGTLLALGVARIFVRRAIAPIRLLTEATEHIEATGDLERRVATTRSDEVARLATRFNAMLDRLHESQCALEQSSAAQRQLVADASHELRTPIASVRTNIEVLLATHASASGDESALLRDVVQQLEELSAVVSDLIELARGDMPAHTTEEVELDLVLAESLTRARRHTPGIEFREQIEPSVVEGSPERIGRAINNLLDNAAKFSGPASVVEVRSRAGTVIVRDYGPGVAPDEMPHLFDRFYRGRRNAPINGSGLGLAIVKQVVESHGGSVAVTSASGGGLEVVLRFPDSADSKALPAAV